MPGNKKTRVFVDTSFLYQSDLPTDVIESTIKYVNERAKRIDDAVFGNCVIAENGLQYYVDVEIRTFDVINMEGKMLYSVEEIISCRYVVYKANIYGIYKGLPVDFGAPNWNETSVSYIQHLVYLPDREKYNKATKYVSYEEPYNGKIMSYNQMKRLYQDLVDKNEYREFDVWIADMLHSGVFEKVG